MLQDRALHDGSLYWPTSRLVTWCRAGITEAMPDGCPVGRQGFLTRGNTTFAGSPPPRWSPIPASGSSAQPVARQARGETQATVVGAFLSSSALACAGCTGPPLIARQLSPAAASTAIGSAMVGRMAST
jgi:hypothetical protein